MRKFSKRRRVAVAALFAAAAVSPVVPAQASTDATPADCDVRLDRLEAQFYEMADRRSYEDAAEWWQARWQAYYESCVVH